MIIFINNLAEKWVWIFGWIVRAFLATDHQAVFLITAFVVFALLFPFSALAAKLLVDPIDYSMTIFISEVPSHTFSRVFETLALTLFAPQ